MLRPSLLAVTVLACVGPVLSAQPVKTVAGPLAVETADGHSLKDEARKKELPYKVYYPKTGGPYPVILFSHGFAGNQDSFGPIGKHWASHGYVVVHPTHADGRVRRKADPKADSDDKPVAQPRPGGLLGGLNDPGKIADRVADLVLILDRLDGLPDAVPGLKGKIDPKSIGVGGHSFGAYTAMLIGGVTVDLGKEKGRSFADKRVKCILPISAQGTGQQGLTEKSWEGLKVPMLTITGTRDQGAGGQGVEWKKEAYKYSPAGDKYLVVIDGANHLSFGGGLGTRNAYVSDIVKLCSVRFWDAYLKDDAGAKKYLQSDELVKDSGKRCVVERK